MTCWLPQASMADGKEGEARIAEAFWPGGYSTTPGLRLIPGFRGLHLPTPC